MKILDLFNEYNLSPEMTWWEICDTRTEDDRNHISRTDRAYIVSKDFWWIKRLVDNDKIDRKKTHEKVKELWMGYWWFDIYSWIAYSCLLMLLAIQNSPLEFLISILK